MYLLAKLRLSTLVLSSGFLLSAVGLISDLAAQELTPVAETKTWAEAAARNEVSIVQREGLQPIRYRVHKRNDKGDTTREIIETPQGAVARLVERDGRPLTSAEDTAERKRLEDTLAAPEDYLRHHRRDQSMQEYVVQLLKLMPTAMIFTDAPGQPQPANALGRQVVLDFRPDPAFHPPTMVANLLTGIEGRIWIDAATHCVTRAEGRVIHPVNFAFGIVARIYPGGNVELEQTDAGGGHWVYSHVTEHLTVREMIFKTAPEDAEMSSSDLRLLPNVVDWQQAIRMLLAMSITTR